ncbi:MAG: glycerol-3-phosphate dehydrogenase subunit GlpB, partial [Propionibacteriaceae bacterium]|nr:glycerol-3-phosphate dehydrogenase subunit GlpB [Propionibacteriaceae bacterium]
MKAVVIGAGLGGLVSAVKLAKDGHTVTLITFGLGGLQLGQGTVDVYGYPDGESLPVTDPFAALAQAPVGHPYAAIGAEQVRAGVDYLVELLGPELLVGGETNALLPTAVGAFRPTLKLQPSMAAGQPKDGAKWVVVGLRQLKDFNPDLIAGNVSRAELPGDVRVSARPLWLDFPARPGEVDSNSLAYARAFDKVEYRQQFAQALKPLLEPGEAVALPAVLGLKDRLVYRDLQEDLGAEVFEIPLPPPSVPGMRLNEALTALAKAAGVRVVLGSRVTGFSAEGGKVRSVTAATAGAPREFAADVFVYAPGGFESGAIAMDSHYQVRETLFDLPLTGLDDVEKLILPDYWGGQP